MSTDIRTALNTATVYISIYLGIPMLIVGVVGGLLNLLVFLSLKTFRQNSCAFYLMVMSAVNVIILITGLLSRITISGFSIDWTQMSMFYCKARVYFNQLSILLSLTCICLATIDQFLSTHGTLQWHRKYGLKLARLLVAFFVFVWILHGIPYLFYYNVLFSSKTGKFSCAITSTLFQQYTVYGFLLILSGTLPLIITILFGLLAYRNLKQAAYRATPLIRRESDKQMTTMVLVHIFFDLFTLVPYIVVSIVALDTSLTNDPISNAYIQFFRIFAIHLYYLYFVVSRIIDRCRLVARSSFFSSAHFISTFVSRDGFANNSCTSCTDRIGSETNGSMPIISIRSYPLQREINPFLSSFLFLSQSACWAFRTFLFTVAFPSQINIEGNDVLDILPVHSRFDGRATARWYCGCVKVKEDGLLLSRLSVQIYCRYAIDARSLLSSLIKFWHQRDNRVCFWTVFVFVSEFVREK